MVVGFAPSTAIRDLSDRDINRPRSHDRGPVIGNELTRRDVQPALMEWVADPVVIAAAQQLVGSTLQSLMELPFDWDSYGGRPVQERAALYAQRLLVPLLAQGVAPPAIVPTSDGGLSLEWDHAMKQLIIQIPGQPQPNEEPSAFYSDDEAQDEWEDLLSSSLPRVREVLARFTP